ncbi:aryl-sulfate sulfotransferase [bacterium]|nr:aryl-sulfate sulfotransferase [bacterium]
MRRFSIIFCVFVLIFSVSCENKLSGPVQEISDDDSDTAHDGDADETPDDDADTEQGPLFNLKVEGNDKNVLSCRLTFSTPDERKTFVKYYSANHSGYKITEETAKNEHYFFLWGMRENLNYTIEIYSDEKTPELLATTEFHSGKVPSSIFPLRLVTNEKESVQPGFLIVTQQSSPDQERMEPIVFMVDTDGFVVWYFEHYLPGFSLLTDPSYQKKTNTLFLGIQKWFMEDVLTEEGLEIDMEGNILWKSPGLPGSLYTETTWHHIYRLLDDDTLLFIRAQYDFDNHVVSDRIVNVDRDYNELWNWGYFDSPDYFDTVTCNDDAYVLWCDWTHTNSAKMFKDENILYFNSLWLGFYKMNMETKEVIWKFGKDADFTMLSEHPYPWPTNTHDPKFMDASRKRLLFYDNGMKDRFYSRIIEYEIDEDAMTAEITFEYDGFVSGHPWFADIGSGDADYLENGNFLVTKGNVDESQNSSIFEVTRDGRVVWEIYTYQEEGFMIELYNAEKFMPPLEFLND